MDGCWPPTIGDGWPHLGKVRATGVVLIGHCLWSITAVGQKQGEKKDRKRTKKRKFQKKLEKFPKIFTGNSNHVT